MESDEIGEFRGCDVDVEVLRVLLRRDDVDVDVGVTASERALRRQ